MVAYERGDVQSPDFNMPAVEMSCSAHYDQAGKWEWLRTRLVQALRNDGGLSVPVPLSWPIDRNEVR